MTKVNTYVFRFFGMSRFSWRRHDFDEKKEYCKRNADGECQVRLG